MGTHPIFESDFDCLTEHMFQKAHRVKSSVAVRNSDRRKLRQRLANFFAHYNEEQLSGMAPAKGDLKENKIYTHKGEALSVFTLDGEPVIMEMKCGTLLPYLYACWKLDLTLPVLHVAPFLLQKFAGGVDLMAPGIILPPGRGPDPAIEKGRAICIKIIGQKHPIAIGLAEQTAGELSGPKLSGRAVRIISCVGDQLWASGSKFIPPQEIDTTLKNVEIPEEEMEKIVENETAEEEEENEEEEEITSESDRKKEQDDLLEYCFKVAVKVHLQPKKELLPVLCSTFYSQMKMPSVPPGKTLEIKKTSAKKLSTFFSDLPDGLLKLETVSKGVERIVTIDFKNVFFRGFNREEGDDEDDQPQAGLVHVMGACSTKDNYDAPVLTQLYANSGTTRDLFGSIGVANSAVMSMNEMRDYVTKYVEVNELKFGRGKLVRLDPLLHKIVYGKGNAEIEECTWEKLYGGVQSKTNPAYSIQFPGQSAPHVKKGKLPKLNVQTKKVSGNKSITMVTGFEGFLIDEHYFADMIKKRAQASVSIGLDVSGKFVQVQCQGNQTKHVVHIFTEVLKLNKRYLHGVEAASASGKKKKKK